MSKNTATAPAKTKMVHGHKGSDGRRPAPSVDYVNQPELFFNREASWLDFNARVLALAATPAIPLLERIKFLSIFSTNLDEFYMVRVAGLMEQVRTRSRSTGADGLSADSSIDVISRRVRELSAAQAKLWLKELMPQLKKNGIEIVSRGDLTEAEVKYLRKYFTRQIYPVLTPMGVDPAHPFPHLPNKSLSLCVMLRSKGAGSNGGSKKTVYAFVEVPQLLARFVPLKGRGKSRRALFRVR